MDVYDYIPFGKENAVSTGQLCAKTGLKGSEIRRAVNELRSKGVPVCASYKGYWISYDNKEISKTKQSLTRRVNKINEAIEGMKHWH